MHASTVARAARVRRPARRGGGAPAQLARAALVALCLLAVAGCGASATRAPGAPTATPAAPFAPTAVVGSVMALRMFDATTGWAATADRLLRTTDGGLHWRDVTPPAPAGSGTQGVGAFPRSAGDAWVVRDLVEGGPGASQSVVSHTTDGGHTWRSITLPVFNVAQITSVDAEHGWMLADLDTADGEQAADIFRTADGGQTWAKVSSAADRPGALPLDGQKFGLAFRDATTGWSVQGDSLDSAPRLHGLFQTRDGGATWQPVPALALPAALAHAPALDEFGRLPTFFSPLVGVLPVEVVSQATGDVADTVLYVTRDGGVTWSPTAPVQVSADVMSLLDSSTWWIVPDDDSRTRLFATSDGGQHWASRTPGTPFAGVSVLSFASGALGWAIGSAGLLRTSDGGRTWTVFAPAPPAA
jgi:photosystem II stability/assembly factor-like uncharacterized protein